MNMLNSVGDPVVCHHACRSPWCHQEVHEGSYPNLGQEGRIDPWGYQAVLHSSGKRGW